MKICYFANPESIHIQRLVNYCDSEGYDVFIITSKINKDLHARQYLIKWGLPTIKLYKESPFRRAFSPTSILHIRNIIDSENPDILHAFYATNYGFLAGIVDKHPLILSILGSDLFINPKSVILRRFVKYALDKADIIHCLFPLSIAEKTFNDLKTDISKTRAILLGVDTSLFRPLEFDRELADKYGIYPNDRLVVYTRGFDPVYDYETFFKAIPIVLNEAPDTKFLALHKPGQKEKGEVLAHELGISNNLILEEWIPRDLLPRLFSLASIYVSTSLSDGASNSLLEAMASELAPIVSDIPANRPWIDHAQNGYLFPVGDSKVLAGYIAKALSNPSVLCEFGKKSREVVQKNADQKKELTKYKDLYLRFMKKQKPTSNY